MIVLVEAVALEADTDGAEDLRDVLLQAGTAARALRGRVIGEGLDLLEFLAAVAASVLVRRRVRCFPVICAWGPIRPAEPPEQYRTAALQRQPGPLCSRRTRRSDSGPMTA